MKRSKTVRNALPQTDGFEFVGTRPVRSELQPPCQLSCPNSGDIRKWIGLVAQRSKLGLSKEEALGQAWSIIVDRNPFPASLGRVCPHPCESGCNRAEKEAPVSIHAMERFLGDWAIEQGLNFDALEDAKRESVGIIGAGPAGLSFGYQMARRGYPVTIYESKAKPGGMLRFGIPDFRLPPDILDAEIDRIQNLGVEIQFGVRIGRELTMDEVRARHDIVFVGIGAQNSRRLDVPGEDGPGCWGGTEFLAAVNSGRSVELGDHVVVIGGGNTALDAARMARRLGAQATICYRRSRDEMPANLTEVEDANEEGVRINFLVAPTAIMRSGDDSVTGVELQHMELSEPDASGRATPRPIPGSSSTIVATAVIVAVSQIPDAEMLGTNDVPHLSGGDFLSLGIAGDAIVQGRKAAEEIHAKLYGVEPVDDHSDEVIRAEDLKLERFEDIDRTTNSTSLVDSRLQVATLETLATFDEADFFQEAARCMSCGSCFGCQNCFMYCNSRCFTWEESPEPGKYFQLNLDACEECSKCTEVCPSNYIRPSVS